MITTETTQFEVKDKVAWITLNRPAAMNSINPELRWQLSEHLNEVENNDDIWLAVITGAGERAFCAGADLKHRAMERNATSEQLAKWRQLAQETKHIIERWHFKKPLIAMVNGYALGGGLEIAMACDIIVAADHAEFGLPEPRRGLIAGSAGVHRLPRQIGLKPAMGYLLTGRHMSAMRAFQLGLVNEVVPANELTDTVKGYVDDILRCAPLAVRATKEAAVKGLDHPLAQAFYTRYEGEVARQQSADALEGPRAFAEKRSPQWQGK
ncbi:enoyl-CoA hydratase-related protein [Pseudomonadales bacterium]|jgi:enoyl-CoA hydratase/carnithine racemase|nr:enoyl-CoA hydratase-related protein [bacterium]MDC0939013.1 enoyl-CoA hydratase-related protein [Pseudomonadales bacterium]|tara:strand:- start:1988 stop:2788 length:801 start_codon:yes stop_codon:yes gene_type:complete